jgi:hypothetical protein
LPALAVQPIGVLGIDAEWAAAEPTFWSNLTTITREIEPIVYLRGVFDFRRPTIGMSLFASMPPESGVEVIAATPTSVWLAPAGASAAGARELLLSSGVFSGGERSTGASQAPVIIEGARDLVRPDGRFPRAVYRGSSGAHGLAYVSGWSNPEPDGCWTEGPSATVTAVIPAGEVPPTYIEIAGNAWLPANEPAQIVEFGVGRKPTAWTEMIYSDESEILVTKLGISAADVSGGKVTVQVRPKKPGRPSDHGGTDTRMLGFKFRTLAFFTSP